MTELNWRKSSYTDQYNCVEVAMTPDTTAVRDSKNRDGDALAFTTQHWHSFLSAIKADHYRH
ncbi:DUF397 domain-containing protein [Saccharopolyspora phatthalungensis]|uniref:DUF397 domain-containing protein n=1 Tax=Saccharopolyspora phatthalungensis TaxID=664693 RepID=A0A840PXW7_9PSEU|nr:DUF397 domain-containing protein [Saccharopolyspora phatthalungensis]MBB5155122.1 hypothetical protein [Saccharopolyspora phatthalungensis]